MQKPLHRILLVLGIVVGLAAAGPVAALTPQDRDDLGRIEDYLNGIKSLKARFVQVAPDGGLSEGDLYLNRPGRLRFEYDPPVPMLVVSDGSWVVFYDREVEQTSRAPLQSTPLFALVRSEIKLRKSKSVKSVERGPGSLRVTLHDPDRADQGSITVVFADQPLGLRQWLVHDAQGQVTTIAMSEMQLNPRLDPGLFTLFSPDYDDPSTR